MTNDQAPMTNAPLIVAITGASGAVYAVRLLEVLLEKDRKVHLIISPSGAAVLKQELDRAVNLERFDIKTILPSVADEAAGRLRYHHYEDLFAPPASGSCLTGGMVV